MKRIIAFALCVLMLVSFASCGGKNEGYSALADLVNAKGETSETGLSLYLGEKCRMYLEDDQILLYRNDTDTVDTIVGVTLYLTDAGMEKGVYRWESLVFYKYDEYKLKGTLTASELTQDVTALSYDSSSGIKDGDALIENRIVRESTQTIKELIAVFAAALKANEVPFSIADYGFVNFEVE